ncbi:MAG: hypothetical protein ACYTGW_10020 [Planctomycetota bacterium]
MELLVDILQIVLWVFLLYCWVRIVLKTGLSTGTIILVILLPPVGVVWLAFAEWPSTQRAKKHRRATSDVTS